MKINNKHITFVDAYYSNGFNATKAYMTAFGVDYDSARCNAPRLMANDSIRALMEEKQAEIRERANIKKEDILTALMNIAYDENTSKYNQLIAMQQINKMLGFNAPLEQNVKISGEARLFSDDDLEIK